MFDGEEEREPRGEGDRLLEHHPAAQDEENLLRARVPAPVGGRVRAAPDRAARLRGPADFTEKERERRDFRDGGRDRRAADPHRGDRSPAEDEDVVEEHVGAHHGDGRSGEHVGAQRRHEVRAQRRAEKRDGKPHPSPEEVVRGVAGDDRVVEPELKDGGPGEGAEEHPDHREGEERDDPGAEEPPDFSVETLAVRARHRGLETRRVADPDHEDREEEHARNRGGAQRLLGRAPEEGGVREADEHLQKEARHHRKRKREQVARTVGAAGGGRGEVGHVGLRGRNESFSNPDSIGGIFKNHARCARERAKRAAAGKDSVVSGKSWGLGNRLKDGLPEEQKSAFAGKQPPGGAESLPGGVKDLTSGGVRPVSGQQHARGIISTGRSTSELPSNRSSS